MHVYIIAGFTLTHIFYSSNSVTVTNSQSFDVSDETIYTLVM